MTDDEFGAAFGGVFEDIAIDTVADSVTKIRTAFTSRGWTPSGAEEMAMLLVKLSAGAP